MLNVDMEETGHLVIILDDGHRTVVSMAHQDGLQLLNQLTSFYGALNVGEAQPRDPQREDQLAAGKQPPLRPGVVVRVWRFFFGSPR